MGRRRLLKGASLGSAGLIAAAVVGCGEEEGKPTAPAGTAPAAASPGATPAAKQPKRGGTLVRFSPDTGLFPGGWDPHTSVGLDAGPMSLFYQYLVRFNPQTYEPEPEVAQKWEIPSPTEFIFTMSPGVKWHNRPPANGRALTAGDVAFSLNRFRTDEPRFLNRGLLGSVDKIEAADGSRVKLTLRRPDASLLANLSDYSNLILAPEVVEKAGKFATPDTAVGTGPFLMQSKDDVSATVVRNPDYWKQGLPYLDSVKLSFIRDPQTRWAGYVGKQVDVCTYPCSPAITDIKKIVAEQGKTYFTALRGGISNQMIQANTKKKPFDDLRVGRALRLLTDHKEAITAWAEPWFGGGGSLVLPHLLESWDLSAQEYATKLEWKQPKDEAVKEALALLSAAGFSKANPLKFEQVGVNIPWASAMAELHNAQLKRLSQGVVEPTLRIREHVDFLTLQNKGEFEVSVLARGGFFEPDQVLRSIYRSTGGQNFGKYNDPKADELIDRQASILNVEQRKAAVKDAIRHLIDNAPFTNFGDQDNLSVWDAKVKNYFPETVRMAGYQQEQVWLDT